MQEFMKGRDAFFRLQVTEDAVLAPIEVGKRHSSAPNAATEVSEWVSIRRWFDLYDIGTEIREHEPGERTGYVTRRLDDPKATEIVSQGR
jgi:hypothetical protein